MKFLTISADLSMSFLEVYGLENNGHYHRMLIKLSKNLVRMDKNNTFVVHWGGLETDLL